MCPPPPATPDLPPELGVRLTAGGAQFSVYAVQQHDAVTPLTQHWNVTFQKQFGENWSATASYFGNKTTR